MAKLTKAQRARLEKLAAYLEGLPADYAHFDMETYFQAGASSPEALRYARHNGGVEACGTVACAVGHGPAAGVLVPPRFVTRLRRSGSLWVNWDGYAGLFGAMPRSREYDWLFDSDWGEVDGHHHSAAARIRYMLDKGIPDDFEDDYSIDERWSALYAPYRVTTPQTAGSDHE